MDPAHTLKLCRNAFATYRMFKSVSGAIDYRYIEDLISHQSDIGLKLANKVRQIKLMGVENIFQTAGCLIVIYGKPVDRQNLSFVYRKCVYITQLKYLKFHGIL